MLIELLQRFWFGFAILVALLFLSVWPFEQFSEFHDSQRMVSAILVAIALSISLFTVRLSAQTIWIIIAVYIWGLSAVYLSPLPLWSMLEFGILFSCVLLGLVLIQKLKTHHIKQLFYVFVSIQAFYVTRNLTDYFVVVTTGARLEPYSLANGFSNTRFYGQFLTWAIPFTIGVLTVNKEFPYRKVISFLVMIEWGLEFLTLNRSFLLAMAATLLAAWWIAKVQWRRYAKLLLLTACGGFGLYLLMLHIIPGLLGLDTSFAVKHSSGRDILNSSGRVQLWLDTVHLFLNHPWLGAGPMMTALDTSSKISAHPHNFVLQLLAEWGILFALFILVGCFMIALKWRKLVLVANDEHSLLALPIAVSLAAAAVAGLFDGLIVMPVSLIYMTLIISMFTGLWRTLTPNDLRYPIPKLVIPVLLAPAVFTAVFAVMNWPHGSSTTSPPAQPMSGNGYKLLSQLNPRFWITGHISIIKKIE